MRILQVDKFLRRKGGAASYMLDLAELQREAGHTVEFFSMQHPDNVPSAHDDLFVPHVELEDTGGGIRTQLQTAGTMVWSPVAMRSMRRVIDAFRPDVVHLHNVYHQLSPSILRPIAKRSIPIVMTAHDFKLVCPSYRLLDDEGVCERCVGSSFAHAAKRRCKDGSLGASTVLAVESSLHRWTGAWNPIDAIISPSAFLAGKLIDGGFASSRVHHVPNFVDTSKMQPRVGTGDGFVFIGRLSHEKGVDVLIRAVARVDGAELRIAGDGPDSDALIALANELAPDRITFVGHVDKPEVVSLLEGARAAVLPARYHENMPMSIIEAAAVGVPMIATELGGVPELIDDGVQGRVVPHEDVDALAGAIAQLHNDDGLAEKMGTAARERVVERYDAADHLPAIERIYAKVGAPVRASAAKGAEG